MQILAEPYICGCIDPSIDAVYPQSIFCATDDQSIVSDGNRILRMCVFNVM